MQYGPGGALGLARTWPQAACVLPTPGTAFDWEGDRPLNLPLEDLVIYEMHVRGFTWDASSKVSSPGVSAAAGPTLHAICCCEQGMLRSPAVHLQVPLLG